MEGCDTFALLLNLNTISIYIKAGRSTRDVESTYVNQPPYYMGYTHVKPNVALQLKRGEDDANNLTIELQLSSFRQDFSCDYITISIYEKETKEGVK